MSDADKFLPPSGSTLQQAFKALVTTFDECGIRYAIIGQAHGAGGVALHRVDAAKPGRIAK